MQGPSKDRHVSVALVLQRDRAHKHVALDLSANYYNASSFAAIYLDANGYDIVPVNPTQAGKRAILNRPVHADLAAAAAAHPRPIEIVDVFRPAREAPAIARQAVQIGAKVLWLQLA